MKCVACGSESLVEGRVASGKVTEDLRFRPADNSYLKTILGLGSRLVRAYGCARCGHLQFVVDFNEEDLRRFLEFEGQQPSVLERLGEEGGGASGQGG